MSNFMKIRRVGAELLHADGQTYMMKLQFAFRSFANAPKNRSAAHLHLRQKAGSASGSVQTN